METLPDVPAKVRTNNKTFFHDFHFASATIFFGDSLDTHRDWSLGKANKYTKALFSLHKFRRRFFSSRIAFGFGVNLTPFGGRSEILF